MQYMTTENQTSRVRNDETTQLIRDYLQIKPSPSSGDVLRWLRQFGIEVSPDVLGSLLAAMKTG